MRPESIGTDTEWIADRNCTEDDTPLFFSFDRVDIERAKNICRGCPVIQQCLEYALEHRIDHGVWGGAEEADRRSTIRRQRRTIL